MKVRLVLLLALWFLGARGSEATLIVSGDGNISNALATPAAFDNDTWFMNLLQGGSQVLVDSSSIGIAGTIDSFYNSQAGVTSSLLVGPLTPAALAGVDLFISPSTSHVYSAGEIALMGSFLTGGGSILLMAEHAGFPNEIANVNAVLTGLGSAMQVSPDTAFCGFHALSGSQIAAAPLNVGVSSFQMGCTSQVTGGSPLFFTDPGFAMVAFEEAASPPVPEPTTLGLLGFGLLALARRRRRG